MIETQLIIEGWQVDLTDDVVIALNLNVIDAKDLSKRKSEFTKTMRIPATKTNNKIFGRIFNLQVDNTHNSGADNVLANFTPEKKANAKLKYSNYTVVDGYIQLRGIDETDGVIAYEVVFYGKLADLMTTLGNKDMDELSIDDIDHTLSLATVTGSWSGNTDYLYPSADYGIGNIRSHKRLSISTLLPAIKVKRYVDEIFDDAGFSYTSDFFETDEFDKLYILYNSDESFLLTDEQIEELTGVGTYSGGFGNLYEFNDNTLRSSPQSEIFEADSDTLENGNIDTVNHEYVVPQDGTYNIVHDIKAAVFTTYTGPASRAASGSATADTELRLAIDLLNADEGHNVAFNYVITDSGSNDVTTSRTFESYTRKTVDLDDNSLGADVDTPDLDTIHWWEMGGLLNQRTTTRAESTGSGDVTQPWRFVHTIDNIQLQEGDRVKINIRWASDWTDDTRIETAGFVGAGAWDPSEGDSMNAQLLIDTVSYFEAEPVEDIVQDRNITYDRMALDEVNQKDFLLSLLKVFNLVAVPDKDNPKNLIIKQRDEFFASGSVVDWSDKIDRSRPIRSTPVRDAQVTEFIYRWNEGTDYWTQKYKELEGKPYGEVKIDNNSEFGVEPKVNDVIFEPATTVEYEDRNLFNIQVIQASEWDSTTWRAENVEDLRNLTGVGQEVEFLIDGVKQSRTITRISEKEFEVNSVISNAKSNVLYGVIIRNRYDRLSVVAYDSDEEDNTTQKRVRNNPKLIYYTGLQNCNQYDLTDGIVTSSKTQYPLAGHLNDVPASASFDYNFGEPDRLFFNTGSNYPTDNLYTEYHKTSLEEIFAGSNIVEAHFKLSNTEVINLSYNDKIYIDGRLYRINQVKDFNLSSDAPVKIELFRITGINQTV